MMQLERVTLLKQLPQLFPQLMLGTVQEMAVQQEQTQTDTNLDPT